MLVLTTNSSKKHQLITVRYFNHEAGMSIEVQLTPNEAVILAARLKEEITKCGKQSKP